MNCESLELHSFYLGIIFTDQIESVVLSNNHMLVGSQDEGPYRLLEPNSNPNVKRRARTRSAGNVLRVNGQHCWDFQYDFNGKVEQRS